MNKSIYICCALLGLLAAITPCKASGATIYVDADNTSGTEDGSTWATAYVAIQDALDASASGDTILVAPGTYCENLVVENDVKLLSTDINSPEDYVIDGGGLGGVVTYSSDEAHSDVSELAGFTIQNGKRYCGGGISGDLTRGALLERGCLAHIHHNIIQNNIADGALWNSYLGRGGGIYFCTGVVEHNVIRYNTAYNSGGGACNLAELDQLSDQFGVFRHNTVEYNIAGAYIETAGAGGVESFREVYANVIRGNHGFYGAAVSRATDVRNNVMSGNVTSRGTTNYCQNVENNTIVANTVEPGSNYAGIFIEGAESDVIIRNNIVWNNDGDQISNFSWYTVTVENCCVDGGYSSHGPLENVWNIVATDPAFVNSASSPPNLHLTAQSPCIDAGTELADLREDIDGNARPHFNGWDIGAYEFEGPPLDCMTCTGAPDEVIVDNPLDSNLDGWQVRSGTWTFVTDGTYGQVLNCASGSLFTHIYHPTDTPDMEFEFSYVLRAGTAISVNMRDALEMRFRYDRMQLYNGNTMWLVEDLAEDSLYDTWYDIHACVTDGRVQVQRRVRGMTGWHTIFDLPNCPFVTTGGFSLRVLPNSTGCFDNLKVCRTVTPYCGGEEADPDLSVVSPIPLEDYQDGLLPGHWIVPYGSSFSIVDTGDGNDNLALRANNTNSSLRHTHSAGTTGNYEVRFSYKFKDITGYSPASYVSVYPRFSTGTQLGVIFVPHNMAVDSYSPSWNRFDYTTVTSMKNCWYDVRLRVEGSDVNVWRRVPGCEWKHVSSRSGFGITPATYLALTVRGVAAGDVLVDNLSVEELP